MNWEVSQKQGQNPEIFLSGISEWPVKEKERYHTKENEICSCFQNQKKKKVWGTVVRPSGKRSSGHLCSRAKVTEGLGG